MHSFADSHAIHSTTASTSKKNTLLKTLCLLSIFFNSHVIAQSTQANSLAELSLEQLAELPVISVSKTAKPVADAPASVFVITQKDILRSGVTSLPEALRLAPNLQVARHTASGYAITARGFNNPFANKLLVMIDGRTIYSPLYSGVFWDTQHVVLEDLERIEVVSGPGGTLWGANAVNGVVNIVSRSAADTQGAMFSLGAGEQQHNLTARYGGQLTNNGHYRVYALHSHHNDTPGSKDNILDSGWEHTKTGFRADWGSGHDTFTVQGDAYEGRIQQPDLDNIGISGFNLLARRSLELSTNSRLSFQGYFDHSERQQPGLIAQRLDTLDVELQHELQINQRHTLMWGGGYRYLKDHVDKNELVAIIPASRNMEWWNVFLQDEIVLTDRTRLTLGSKLESNPFTGHESLPSAQLAWSPNDHHLVWLSWSRAVRSPARIDRDLFSPGNPYVVNGTPQYLINGGADFVSEVAKVFELGFRSQPSPALSWSITGFYSTYDKLRTLGINYNGPGFAFQNNAEADVHGIEVWGSIQAASNWRWHGGLVWQDIDVSLKPGSIDISGDSILGSRDPRYYGLVRSSYDISAQIKLDATLRHVDELEDSQIPAYTTLDINLSWAISPRLQLSLIGHNLLESQHPEFGSRHNRGEFERTFYGKLVWGL